MAGKRADHFLSIARTVRCCPLEFSSCLLLLLLAVLCQASGQRVCLARSVCPHLAAWWCLYVSHRLYLLSRPMCLSCAGPAHTTSHSNHSSLGRWLQAAKAGPTLRCICVWCFLQISKWPTNFTAIGGQVSAPLSCGESLGCTVSYRPSDGKADHRPSIVHIHRTLRTGDTAITASSAQSAFDSEA